MADDNTQVQADAATANAEALSRMGDLVVAVNTLNNTVAATFPNFVTVPANSTASGVAGQVAYDNTHFYWCASSNSWLRVTGSTF